MSERADPAATAKRERPILFAGRLVRAILEGRKTQTRRVVRNPERLDGLMLAGEESAWCPYGKPGDRLWVREAFSFRDFGSIQRPELTDERWYWADGPVPTHGNWTRPRPSIHMPRWASRITLEVLSVRVERLQEIGEEDAIAEGLSKLTKDDGRTWKYGIADRDGLPGNDDDGWHWSEWDVDPRRAFAKGWDTINAKRTPWASNPWVWVVEFKRIER